MNAVEEHGIPLVVKVGPYHIVETGFHDAPCPHTDALAIEAFKGTGIALKQAACFFQADVIFHGEIHIALRMGQDGLIAHVQKPLHFIYRDNIPYLSTIADGKLDEDVIAFPGQ